MTRPPPAAAPRRRRPTAARLRFIAVGFLLVRHGMMTALPSVHAQQVSPADAPAAPAASATPSATSLFPNAGATRPTGTTTTTTTTTSTTQTPAPAESRSARRRAGDRRQRRENPLLSRAATDPLEVKIAYRRAETEALRDPSFAELLRQAEAAPTDEEKRAFLGRYYQGLFARIRRIAKPTPALTAHIDLLARAAELRYAPKRRAGAGDELEAGRGRGRRR